MALLTSIDKYSKDRLASFRGSLGGSQRLRDLSSLLCYGVAFIVSIVLV